MGEVDYSALMLEALALARKGRFKTFPNPAVGAVLVRNGKIVASGWHQKSGLSHAEINCLANAKAAGIDPKGAELIVTLEPCAHYGKTPPCASEIIGAGIRRVVFGAADPNPEAKGGAEMLRAAGIDVAGPVLEQKCLDMISDFALLLNDSRPYVILKLASTLDGRIATRNGHSQWISGASARQAVHCLRADIASHGGAILIGGGTFRADNPKLSARCETNESGCQPLACVLTSRLPKPDADFYLLRERPEQTIFFASPAAAASTTAESLRKIGCRVYAIGPGASGGPDFALMFKILRKELNCPYVLCEGGGKLALSLMEAGFIDEFHLYMAPLILGDNDARPLFNGLSPLGIDEALKMRLCEVNAIDGDAFLLLRPLNSN